MPAASRAVLDRSVRVAAAMADRTRLGILLILAGTRGPLCACDIQDRFRLSQPTVSHHLRVLKDAGLVTSRRRGRWMHFELRRDRSLKPVARILARLLGGGS